MKVRWKALTLQEDGQSEFYFSGNLLFFFSLGLAVRLYLFTFDIWDAANSARNDYSEHGTQIQRGEQRIAVRSRRKRSNSKRLDELSRNKHKTNIK